MKKQNVTSYDFEIVTAVSCKATHGVFKQTLDSIKILKGLGVEGDAHQGKTVKHRFLAKKDPNQPNLRQIHLIHAELHDELQSKGFNVSAGQMGENITTRNIDLLSLPTGTQLHIGNEAIIEITGLRNPCKQLEEIQKGLTKAVLTKDEQGKLIIKSGIMGIVLNSGTVRANDKIQIALPQKPYKALKPV